MHAGMSLSQHDRAKLFWQNSREWLLGATTSSGTCHQWQPNPESAPKRGPKGRVCRKWAYVPTARAVSTAKSLIHHENKRIVWNGHTRIYGLTGSAGSWPGASSQIHKPRWIFGAVINDTNLHLMWQPCYGLVTNSWPNCVLANRPCGGNLL